MKDIVQFRTNSVDYIYLFNNSQKEEKKKLVEMLFELKMGINKRLSFLFGMLSVKSIQRLALYCECVW